MTRIPRAFTLIELLVVVTIIVVLLALLTPALDKAVTVAEKAVCLTNQRSITQGCLFYAAQNRGVLPYYPPSEDDPSAYDWRSPWKQSGNQVLLPAGFGMLPAGNYLPTATLAKVIHCPNIDSSSAGNPPGALAYIGMDRRWLGDNGAGGSWWTDPAFATRRILGSYNYRGASWVNAGKGQFRTNRVGSRHVLSIDFPDMRFGGLKYIHPDGYNRAFADGHASFFADPKAEVERMITGYNPDRYFAGIKPYALPEEEVFEYVATDH